MEARTINANGIANRRGLTNSSYVSASRLKLWLKCPLAYKLRYVDGIITPSNTNLLLGRVVHRALERFYRYRERGITLFPEFVAEHIERIWESAVEDELLEFNSTEEELELQRQAKKLVATYLSCESVAEEAPPLAVEERFETPLIDPLTGENLGIPLVGIVDLVVDEGSGPVIADFKTAARSSNALDIVHELQLTCYSYLFRQVTGRTEHALEIRSLIKTKTPKVEFERYPARRDWHFARLFAVIRAYLEAVNSNKYHIRPGFDCSWCDFRQMCTLSDEYLPDI